MKSTIHFYDVPTEHMILAARAATSFGKQDYKENGFVYGGNVAEFWCWRTRIGNISIRWLK